MAFVMTSVSVIMGIDPATGDEAVWAYKMPDDTWIPMVCADEQRLKLIYPVAQQMSAHSGIPFRVIQFTVPVDITEETNAKYGQEYQPKHDEQP